MSQRTVEALTPAHIKLFVDSVHRDGGDERLAELLEAMPDGIVVVDARGTITHANHQAEAMLGYAPRELPGQQIEVLVPDRSRAHHGGLRAGFAATRQARPMGEDLNLSARRKDGTELPVEISLSPLGAGADRVVVAAIRDVTERRRSERAVRESEARMADLLAGATEYSIIGTDLGGTVTVFNAGAERMLGFAAADVVGQVTLDRFHDPAELAERASTLGLAPDAGVLVAAARRDVPETREWSWLRKDGTRVPVSATITAMHDAAGDVSGFIVIAGDISARIEAETKLRLAEERFRTAFADAPVGLTVRGAAPGASDRHLAVNRAMCDLTGYSEAELLDMPAAELVHPADVDEEQRGLSDLLSGQIERVHGERRYVHADGRIVEVWTAVSLVRDEQGRPLHFITQAHDVSARKQYERQLRYMADHDALTGLPNRKRFEEQLARQIARVRRYGAAGAILMIDLDRFKRVNDRLGHNAGDELLVSVARILQARIRETDMAARFGGDEFVVLMSEGGEKEAQALAGDLSDRIRRGSLTFEGEHVPVTASIGVAVLDDDPDLAVESVLMDADAAMYSAKQNGRDRIAAHVTEDGQRQRRKARLTLHSQIDRALERDAFVLHAQPVMNLLTGGHDRYELLLRMVAENGTIVPPGRFLYVAERFDQIARIDRWVITQAVDLLRRLEDAGSDIRLELNLSGRSIGDDAIAEHIGDCLERTGADPHRLIFEITETAAVENIERAKHFAHQLTGLGCQFALDDFGAGFGSFYYLKHIPFDYLKIDGEFIRHCTESRTDQLVIQSCVQLAKGLGKQTIAECVENAETLRLLRALGVDHVQGYHVAKPAPLSELEAFDVGPRRP